MHHRLRAAVCRFAFALPAALAAFVFGCGPAHPADATTIAPGNTAWVLAASALVLFMTLPGLGLFYGGLVRARNLLSVLMHCFTVCAVVSVIWLLFGYSLVFDGSGALIGGLGKCFLAGVAHGIHPQRIPEYAFVLFQMTFAVITPALIVGAFAERVRFSFVVAFTVLWTTIVYLPVAHWIWGGGWLAQLGVIDFAGGIVVHTTAGVSALIAALMVGARRGFPHSLVPPHSPGLTMAGAGMLWFGWFGFNGGSALAANSTAASAILATHFAAAAAALTWIGIEWWRAGKPTSIGLVTGAVAGLATITPASGYVSPLAALAMGIVAGAVCFQVTGLVKQRLRIDDSLDVFAVHGVGGMVGTLLVAVFASSTLGGAGYAAGVGMGRQVVLQILGIAAAAAWSAAATFAIVKILAPLTGLRVNAEAESDGLDLATHGERAYDHG